MHFKIGFGPTNYILLLNCPLLMLCDSLIYSLLGTISRYFVIELLTCLMFHDKTCGVSQFVKIAFLVSLNVILLLYGIVSGKIDVLVFFFFPPKFIDLFSDT